MLRTDLKIFKSQRMTQNANAGGQRTANEVANGQLNDVFGNISAIDHAQSALDIVKIYAGVSTANTALLQDAHVLINEPPEDPQVDIIMIESAAINDASTRAEIVNIIESGVTPGLLLRSGLSEMASGQNIINAFDLSGNAGVNEQPVVSLNPGSIIAISVEYTGAENVNFPRFTHFAKVVTAILGQNVIFEPGIPFNAPGRDTNINSQTRCTKLRAVTVNDNVTYHGCTRLTAPVSAAAQILPVAKTTGQLLPRLTQAVVRAATKPFDTINGLQRKTLTTPANGINYVLDMQDAADLNTLSVAGEPMFIVNYIADGALQSRTFNNASYSAGTFTFSLPVQPDAGTDLYIYYFDATVYQMWSNSTAMPAGYSVAQQTIRGTIVFSGSTRSAEWRTDGVYAQVNSLTWQLAAIVNTDGSVSQYVNGYSNLQYTAVIQNDAGAGVITTSVNFVLAYDDIITDTLYITAQLAAGGAVSASADANGTISGVGVSGTVANGVVSLTFTAAITRSSLSYTVTELLPLTPPASLYGINQLRLTNNGRVPIFRPFGVVNISHNQYSTAADLPNGTTLNQRPNAFIDIVDSNGASLWHPLDAHYSYNKTTGVVTIVDTTGFTGPFEISDTIAEMALVSDVTQNALQLTAPLNQDYPAGSVVSSVQVLGNLQASAEVLFDMTTWSNVWSDTITGSPAVGNFNELNYPIEVENRSAINERWVIVFTSPTAFNCIGKGLGLIASGDTLNDFAPINPNTQQPYFVIRKQGWGGGWNAGECVRLNTYSSFPPIVLARPVSAGHSQIEQDSIRLHFRGNAD
ncbi:hypothetical protein H1D31_00015 [Alishewanella sp. BS5-314]|uniref:hypothetical protein n=1 Tax=Alishewanella sp. BS5-314 TaxID=2755587 RepID=UPI0021BAEB53|nr:hypothetical protein [Alishewanella sp. BS5-314]MCT8124421.1 hypothetical protein [Alishewanella sp. BS5-314]